MKKLLFLLVLMLTTLGAQAQDTNWWQPVYNDAGEEIDVNDSLSNTFNASTPVYAQFTNEEVSYFMVGAFIDGELRGLSTDYSNETVNAMLIRVWGNMEELGQKNIVFKAVDTELGAVYTLPVEIAFDGESHGGAEGVVSDPLDFGFTPARSFIISVDEFEVGQTYDMMDYVTLEPEDGLVPDNLEWWATSAVVTPTGDGDASDYVTVKGSTVTALQASADGVYLHAGLNTDAGQFELGLSNAIPIVIRATAINLNETAFQVNKEDSDSLARFMTAAYAVVPAGSTDEVMWEVTDQTIISYERNNKTGSYYYNPIKGGTTTIRPYIVKKDGTKLVPRTNSNTEAWITVTVYVPVESIDIDYDLLGDETIYANMGDQKLGERLSKLISVSPADATDQTFTFQVMDMSPEGGDLIEPVVKVSGTTITPLKAGSGQILISSNGLDNQGVAVTNTIYVEIEDPATAVSFASNPYYVTLTDGQVKDISSGIEDNIKFTGDPIYNPTLTVTVTDGTCVTGRGYYSADVDGLAYNFSASAVGTATITVTMTYNNYDAQDFVEPVIPTKEVTGSFQVNVQNELTLASFDIKYVPAVAGRSAGSITFIPQPKGATFDPASISFNIDAGMNGTWEEDNFSIKQISATQDSIVYEYESTIPTLVMLSATPKEYDATTGVSNYKLNGEDFALVEAQYNLSLSKGWQWRNNIWGHVSPDMYTTTFGGEKTDGKLVEIRTQNDLLYNDPQWGYFGTLTEDTLYMYQCYQVKMNAPFESQLSIFNVDFSKIPYGYDDADTPEMTIPSGWSWIGMPYFFNRSLDKFTEIASADILEGTVIQGKDGSAEFADGGWVGDLEIIEAGKGYLIKNVGSNPITLTLPDESDMAGSHDDASAGVKGFEWREPNVWNYDPSRFMSNMSLVTVLEGIANPRDYSVGAFVDDECRGEGFVQNGRTFITVHCEAGETVSFKLYNKLTGTMEDIHETVKAQLRVGSYKSPYLLHGTVTGISSVENGQSTNSSYDLTGRRSSSMQHGVSLQRMSDGSVRKVLK